jgi:hypothetical protein
MDGLVLGAARFYPLHRAAHCAVVVRPKMPTDLRKTLPAVASNQVDRHSPRGTGDALNLLTLETLHHLFTRNIESRKISRSGWDTF